MSVTLHISVDERWQSFVDRVVREGRYGSASDVVGEGLRLVEERERKLGALRTTLEASIARGGEYTDAQFEADLVDWSAEVRSRGTTP